MLRTVGSGEVEGMLKRARRSMSKSFYWGCVRRASRMVAAQSARKAGVMGSE